MTEKEPKTGAEIRELLEQNRRDLTTIEGSIAVTRGPFVPLSQEPHNAIVEAQQQAKRYALKGIIFSLRLALGEVTPQEYENFRRMVFSQYPDFSVLETGNPWVGTDEARLFRRAEGLEGFRL